MRRPFGLSPPARLAAALVPVLALVLLVSSCGGAAGQSSANQGGKPSASADPGGGPRVTSPAPNSASTVTAPAPPPTRVVIPSLQVDAAVEPVATDAQGRMATPAQANDVAWFKPGAAPGDSGNAVFAGHLDWTSGPAVFWHLGELKPGAEVQVVRADGSRLRFAVDGIKQYAFDADPSDVFTRSGPPGIALVTCTGAWDRARQTYLQRLSVHASLLQSGPSSTPGDEAG
jgi:sortase (surface protein transpeptidase)